MGQNLALRIIYFTLILIIYGCGDQCRKVDCRDNGSCFEGACICDKWYSGDSCQLAYNRNYEGVYVGVETKEGISNKTELVVKSSDDYANRLLIVDGIYFEFFNDSIISVPLQSVLSDSGEILVKGQGISSEGEIDFWYDIQTGTEDPLKSGESYYYFKGSR